MRRRHGSVLVAMSGGVDSAVAAALLKRRGFDVIGVTMQIWQESQSDPRHGGCCSLGAVEDARRAACSLDIPHYVVNLQREFADTVIADFVSEYRRGRTPNPCVQCNRYVKFDALMSKADELGCDFLATGHYARVRFNRHTNRWNLCRAVAVEKDQTYALYMLSQDQLRRVMFPLGELAAKEQTRRVASQLGLSVAQKPDSQEICFVAEAGGYGEFIRSVAPDVFAEGDIRDASGRTLGKHSGVALYTIGQRRRIQVNSGGVPFYVIGLEPEQNAVIVGTDEELKRRTARVSQISWSSIVRLDRSIAVNAKIRYNMTAVHARLHPTGDESEVELEFESPVRAVTPGQMAVFYRSATVVGGGVIEG